MKCPVCNADNFYQGLFGKGECENESCSLCPNPKAKVETELKLPFKIGLPRKSVYYVNAMKAEELKKSLNDFIDDVDYPPSNPWNTPGGRKLPFNCFSMPKPKAKIPIQGGSSDMFLAMQSAHTFSARKIAEDIYNITLAGLMKESEQGKKLKPSLSLHYIKDRESEQLYPMLYRTLCSGRESCGKHQCITCQRKSGDFLLYKSRFGASDNISTDLSNRVFRSVSSSDVIYEASQIIIRPKSEIVEFVNRSGDQIISKKLKEVR